MRLPKDFESLKDFYEYRGKNVNIAIERMDAKWNASNLLSVTPPLRNVVTALEIGCGHGMLLKNVCKKFQIKESYGIDISESILRMAKRELPDAQLMVGDAEQLPLQNNSIDLIILSDILEHLKNPWKALKEVKRVGKKYVMIKIPIEKSMKNIASSILGKSVYGMDNPSGHLHSWNKCEALSMIGNAGLSIIEYRIASPPEWMRYRMKRFKSLKGKKLLTIIEKYSYKKCPEVHFLLFSSSLFVFCKTI